MKKLLSILTLMVLLTTGCGTTQVSPPADIESPTDTYLPVTQTSAPETDPVIPTSTVTTTPSTNFPTSTTSTKPVVTTTPEKTNKTYSMDEVKAANTPDKCWTVIKGEVYNLTAWIAKHPGGDKAILKLCGINGTDLFVNKHGGQPQPERALQGFEIGKLK